MNSINLGDCHTMKFDDGNILPQLKEWGNKFPRPRNLTILLTSEQSEKLCDELEMDVCRIYRIHDNNNCYDIITMI